MRPRRACDPIVYPNLTMKIRHAPRHSHQSQGVCSARKAFAMYMLDVVADLPPLPKTAPPDQVELRAAADVFLSATEKLRASSLPASAGASTSASSSPPNPGADGEKTLSQGPRRRTRSSRVR